MARWCAAASRSPFPPLHATPAEPGCNAEGEGVLGVPSNGKARRLVPPRPTSHLKNTRGPSKGMGGFTFEFPGVLRIKGRDAGRAKPVCNWALPFPPCPPACHTGGTGLQYRGDTGYRGAA